MNAGAPGSGPPLLPVEAVRDQLRRLGYLDSGLDRFVLGTSAPRSPLRASAHAALRVGLLGGAFGAAALVLFALSLDQRLLREPRDLLLLTIYLFAALGGVAALLAFLAGLLATWSVRRTGRMPGPRLARNLGLFVGGLGLVYVALWWQSHAAQAGGPLQALALVLGSALAWGLGRFASSVAVAVFSAAGRAPQLPQARLSRRQLTLLLGGAGLFMGAALALASAWGQRPQPGPDFAVLPTGLHVRVLALDGLEGRLTRVLLERGELPHLQALLAQAAWGRLRAEPERIPAIVWTTLATGRGPEAHGIQAVGVRRLPGMRTPVPATENALVQTLGTALDLLRLTRTQPPTSVLRSVKTFWNVASEKGLRVGVVNWWATWPADTLNGFLVSERTIFKLEKQAAADREVFPAEAFERLRPLATDARLSVSPDSAGTTGAVARAARLDRFHLAALHALRAGGAPDVEALYLPGLDIVTTQELGDAPTADLAALELRLAAVRGYYRFVDGLLGEVRADLGAQDVLLLVADPGRLARTGATPAEGLVALVGAPVAPGDLGQVGARDVAPTVLHLVGLPVSRELEGHVLLAALTPAFREQHPLRQVDTYGQRRSAAPAESRFDRQMIEELRSLGYVQ